MTPRHAALRAQWVNPPPVDPELIAEAIAAENVRRVLTGVLVEPLPGTLAAAVKERIDGCLARS